MDSVNGQMHTEGGKSYNVAVGNSVSVMMGSVTRAQSQTEHSLHLLTITIFLFSLRQNTVCTDLLLEYPCSVSDRTQSTLIYYYNILVQSQTEHNIH